MSRAKDTAVDEYCKKNSRLYSMITEYNYNKITIIPMSLSTLCDFKEKCKNVSNEIGLKNYYIYEYKDNQDINCRMVYGNGLYSDLFIDDSSSHVFEDALRYCDYFKRQAKKVQIMK